MLGSLAALLPSGIRCVLVDGPAGQAELFAGRLTEELAARGAEAAVTTDSRAAWDLAVFLRTPHGGRERAERAHVVVDLHDVTWPVIRRVAAPLAGQGPWYLTETRAFFACRAATWDTKFGDDGPAYRAAVAGAGIRRGGTAIDIGCGTGRALPPLRAAVGPAGAVIALDITPEMLQAARPAAVAARAVRVLGDARVLPFADQSADVIFAAGLVNHLPDTEAGLRELARVTRPGGLLVLFHPSGRAALATRHGHSVTHDEPLAEGPLRRSTAASCWHLTAYDDGPHRFFAVAERRPG
jgi:2-polyprenyl-3-methyl-5-hydroxy-6-metoxy-1,4-benzoquinol methylase